MFDGVRGAGIGVPYLAISDTGSLVYAGGNPDQLRRTLVWVDGEGREEPLSMEPRNYFYPRISPDGTKVALEARGEDGDIWVWEFSRQTLTRLTFAPETDGYPVWTPDGQRVAFSSRRAGGAANIFLKAADGTGEVEQLTDASTAQYPYAFSPDGFYLVFNYEFPERSLGVLSMEGENEVTRLFDREFRVRNAEISPDGLWLAYQSNESGQNEIYVSPFPGVDESRELISTSGGTDPLWGPDGRELFYQDERDIVGVPIRLGPSFQAGTPEVVIEGTPYVQSGGGRMFDISPDGERFLMIKSAGEADGDSDRGQIHIIFNWFEELTRRVPAGN